MKSIIVAYDKNRGIGAANDLLWTRDLPADLRHFKELTTGHSIIMGRRTYESLGRPLPNRKNIVISHSTEQIPDVIVVGSLDEAYAIANDAEIFIIGGGQIYQLAIDGVDRLLVTEVDGSFEADVFFPAVNPAIWIEVKRDHHPKDELNKYDYDFVTYERR
ncbi:MAG: dihydrofolate reductase [Candidatus Saccharibacteria bacterium]|nr:dihydrofolate reductase [Candidatus Saccharibacteria bacterium]